MRLPNSVHAERPWRIHEIVRDFHLEDVWALPTPGGREDFHRLVQETATIDIDKEASFVVRSLFALRWKIGGLLGWDDEGEGLGSRVPTLRDQLPDDLRDAPTGPEFGALPLPARR